MRVMPNVKREESSGLRKPIFEQVVAQFSRTVAGSSGSLSDLKDAFFSLISIEDLTPKAGVFLY
jgi:hypothetical protein